MAEVARWIEGPLKSERYRDSVFHPIEDGELSERIRSLLSLHNRDQSPSALRPSPGFTQSVNEPEGLYAGHRPISRRSSTTNATKPIARLSLKDFQQPFKSIQEPPLETSPHARLTTKTKFSQDNGHRDSQNQPDIEQGGRLDRDEEESLEATSTTSPLTPRAPIGPSSSQSGCLASQPTSDSRRPMSYPAKAPVRPRLPLYNLQMVPAHTRHQPEAPMNPEILHVPGDYQSETGASTPRGFQGPSELNEALNSSIHGKSSINSRAVKTLSSVKGYDGSDSALSSNLSLRTVPSKTTLASTNSTLPSGRPPSDMVFGQPQHGEVAEPKSTLERDRWPYLKGLGPSTAEPGDQGSKDILTQLQSLDAHGQEANVDSRDQATHPRVVSSDYSASMRPEASNQAPQLTELLTIDNTTAGTKDAPGRRPTVLYSPSEIEDRPVKSFHKPTGFDGNLQAKSPMPDINKNQSDDVAKSYYQARRSPSLDSVQRQKIPPNIDDDRRLKEQANAIADPKPKRHWIRALLSLRSNTSFSYNQSNLTARPTRQNSSAGTTAKRHKPGNWSELAVPDVTKSSESINGRSGEKIIALQEQKTTASFTKVVQDLETLLKEALSVARQAADLSGNRHGPLVTNSPFTSRSSFQSVDQSENSSRLSGGPDEEEHYTSSPLQYNHGDISTDANSLEPRFVLNKDAKPYPGRSVAPTRHQSILSVPEWVKICPMRVSSHPAKEINLEYSNTSEVAGPADKAAQQDHNAVSSVIGDVQDWAFNMQVSHSGNAVPMPQRPEALQTPLKEQNAFIKRENAITGNLHRKFVIQPRISSAGLRSKPLRTELSMQQSSKEVGGEDFQGGELPSGGQYRTTTQHNLEGRTERPPFSYPAGPVNSAEGGTPSPRDQAADKEHSSMNKLYTLKNRRHYSIREGNGFSLSRSHRRAPVARDWSTPRKRYVATVSCISTALMGLIIGIYAGEVPAIQYAIQDEHHYSILGNVVLFSGLAITTLLFWPLPLLHGRKPYVLAAFALILPLQFPQALAVGPQQKEHIAIYRVGLLVSRAISGLVMGFASLNFKNILLDLFGASLQSANPHQETVNKNDVRRHGGGMGIWLGIWTWCSIGSIGTGFLVGAVIISRLSVAWGFWIVIILCAFVFILNVFSPETRRSAYRRSMAEVRKGQDVSRRVARGEIKMHIDSTGPIWWGEELLAGWRLCVRMLKQPGFLVLSFYVAWIYGQVIMVIVVSSCEISLMKLWLILQKLLGALISKYYLFRPQYVGLCVAAIPIGALLAIPFQKASLFSRSRKQAPRTDSMTVRDRVTWTSHLVRRAIFMIVLPFAGLAYTLASGGVHIHFMAPTVFAGLIGFLSNLAIAECNGIIMETYDTSDLQPGMTGRPRHVLPEEILKKTTNYSCYPRVTAAFAIIQTLAFLIAAAVTAWGGVIERSLGAQTATAVIAGVLLVLTFLLMGVLWRFREVQIIPSERFGTNILSGPENEWKPIIIGNPSGKTRRMSILELGKQSRWSEIRRRNKLVEF